MWGGGGGGEGEGREGTSGDKIHYVIFGGI